MYNKAAFTWKKVKFYIFQIKLRPPPSLFPIAHRMQVTQDRLSREELGFLEHRSWLAAGRTLPTHPRDLCFKEEPRGLRA